MTRKRNNGKRAQHVERVYAEDDRSAFASSEPSRRQILNEKSRANTQYRGTGTENLTAKTVMLTVEETAALVRKERWEEGQEINAHKASLTYVQSYPDPGEYSIEDGGYFFVLRDGSVKHYRANIHPPTVPHPDGNRQSRRAAAKGKTVTPREPHVSGDHGPIESVHGTWRVTFESPVSHLAMGRGPFTNLPRPDGPPQEFHRRDGDWSITYTWSKSRIARDKLIHALNGNIGGAIDSWALSHKARNKAQHSLNGNGKAGRGPGKKRSTPDRPRAPKNRDAVRESVKDGAARAQAAADPEPEDEIVPLAPVKDGDNTLDKMDLRPVCHDFKLNKCTRKVCKFAHRTEPPPADPPVQAATAEAKPEKHHELKEEVDPAEALSAGLKSFTELVRHHYFCGGTDMKAYKACKGKMMWLRMSAKPALKGTDAMRQCEQIIVDERARYTDPETLVQKAAVHRNQMRDRFKDWAATPLAFIPMDMSLVRFQSIESLTDGTVGQEQVYGDVAKPNFWKPADQKFSIPTTFSFGMTLFADHIWMPRVTDTFNAEDGMRKRQLLSPISTKEVRLRGYRAGLAPLAQDWGSVPVPDAELEEKRETFLDKYPGKRAACIASWKVPVEDYGYYDNRAIADVKREWLFRKPDGKNNPRIISTHHESQLLYMGPEVYHEFNHRKKFLFGGHDWVTKKYILVGGMDAVRQASIVTFNEGRGWYPHESDGSRWDGRTEKEGLDVEVELWKAVGMEASVADKLALNINTSGRCRVGGKYKTVGKRDSGTMNTSDGNGAEGHLIDAGFLASLPREMDRAHYKEPRATDIARAFIEDQADDPTWEVGVAAADPIGHQVARNGDDMMGFTSRRLTPLELAQWSQHYTNCGHKAPVYEKSYDDLEFNGGMFPRIGSGGRIWAPYIGKMCAKLFMPKVRGLTKEETEDHIYGVALGMKAYLFMPILGPILAAILARGRPAPEIEQNPYKCTLTRDIEVDKDEVYDYYNVRYGIDVGSFDYLRTLPFHECYRAWTIPGMDVIGRKDGIIHAEPAELGVIFNVLSEQQNFIDSWKDKATPVAVAAAALATNAVRNMLPDGELVDAATETVRDIITNTDVGQALTAATQGRFDPVVAVVSSAVGRARIKARLAQASARDGVTERVNSAKASSIASMETSRDAARTANAVAARELKRELAALKTALSSDADVVVAAVNDAGDIARDAAASVAAHGEEAAREAADTAVGLVGRVTGVARVKALALYLWLGALLPLRSDPEPDGDDYIFDYDSQHGTGADADAHERAGEDTEEEDDVELRDPRRPSFQAPPLPGLATRMRRNAPYVASRFISAALRNPWTRPFAIRFVESKLESMVL